MSEMNDDIDFINIENELKRSYLDYAMSVIVGRALPDIRDGLKHVQRRILYAMHGLSNDFNKPYKKSARILGDVVGKYHPHGDQAVYDAIVRMAQTFSLRYVLIDGQGNFGSVDGDSAAAFRYTEIRMDKLAHQLIIDIEKDTVDFTPNYDNSETEPTVLPTRVPNLLINGATGIAVGMATNIPPHNITEIMNACLAYISDESIDISGLMDYVSGPDFPTGGIINGRHGIIQAYQTGRGKIYVRGRVKIETDSSKKESIIVYELPYMVNKARLLEKIAWLVKEKKIDGITALRDESDRNGMRMVIEVKRGENSEVLLNRLYMLTQLQTVFGINMVALQGNMPKCHNLKEFIECFVKHRREVVRRRTLFELAKARTRAHILEGLAVAIANIDEIIKVIKSSPNPQSAKEALTGKMWPMNEFNLPYEDNDVAKPAEVTELFGPGDDGCYRLSNLQAQAILDLKLHRLTGLERDKVLDEYNAVIKLIHELLDIINNYKVLMELIQRELEEIRDNFSDERKTEVQTDYENLEDLDLIPNDPVTVIITQESYVKTQMLDTYQAQHRGGKGKTSGQLKDSDRVKFIMTTKLHDTLLCFTNLGRIFWLQVHKLPMVSRQSKGRPIVNFLNFSEGEELAAILPISSYDDDKYIFFSTCNGIVKKTSLKHYSRPRSTGINAIELDEGDALLSVQLIQDNDNVFLFSNSGKVIRFEEDQVRSMGRTARGVIGMRLKEDQRLIASIITSGEGTILTASKNGYGKRTHISQYRKTGRGGQGITAMITNDKVGLLTSAAVIEDSDELFLISNKGTLVRIHASEISLLGRSTQGVRLMRLTKGEILAQVEPIKEEYITADDDSNDNA